MTQLASTRLGLQKRELRADDGRILLEATLINFNWNGTRFSADDVLSHPDFAHYTVLVPQRGDFGVVAAQGPRWMGVSWVLFLPEDAPGYGFVKPGIGELSLCVHKEVRRQGLGRELLGDAIQLARSRGLEGLSLSVEEGNPARSLYRSTGFVDASDAAQHGTMVRYF